VHFRRHALLEGKNVVRSFHFLPNGNIELFINNSTQCGQLTSRFVSPILTIFVVRSGQQRFSILAATDSMDADSHRQLRIRLRNAPLSGQAPADSV
jgi:hypothetical protein